MVAFQSLYRRYRPQRFEDLVGQDHVATALRNAVREGRVGHAYLFSGPRGTGKTTTARILAKALNCTSVGDDGEPCGECENCLAVASGTFNDLVELDAASNTGVDAVRDLIDRVHLGMGASTRRKVYLVDEVHMLSNAASNALLKTLEEPPEHVVFVLATTNPEKVLPTIRSRTQHFGFSLIPTDLLAEHLAGVLRSEGVEADAEALDAVARAGAGSARDALSLLDQALAHEPGRLRAESVAAIFGRTPFELRARILEAVAAADAAAALGDLQDLLESGHEPRRVAADLLQALRDAFVLHAAAGRVRVDLPDAERERLAALGAAMGEGALARALEALGQAVVDMRGVDAADPRLVLEVALLRIAHRRAGPPLHVLADRVERLERALGGGALPEGASAPPAAPGAAPPASGAAEPPVAAPEPVAPRTRSRARPPGQPAGDRPRAALGALLREGRGAGSAAASRDDEPTAAAVDIDDVIVAWADVLAGLAPGARSVLQEAQPLRLEGDVVVFGAPPAAIARVKPRFQQEASAIRDAFSARTGLTPRFSVVPHDGFSAEIDLRTPADGDATAPPSGESTDDHVDPSEPADPPGAPADPSVEPADRSVEAGARPPEAADPSAPAGAPHPEPADRSVGAGAPPPEPADDHIDTSELVDAPPTGVVADPTARLVEIFDATIVDEIPRGISRD